MSPHTVAARCTPPRRRAFLASLLTLLLAPLSAAAAAEEATPAQLAQSTPSDEDRERSREDAARAERPAPATTAAPSPDKVPLDPPEAPVEPTDAVEPPPGLPAAVTAPLAAAQSAVDAGDMPRAIELYEGLVDNPDRTVASLAMGKLALVLSWEGRYADSAEMYDRWRDEFPEAYADATYGRARVLGWGRQYRRALAEIDDLLDKQPWNREIRYLEGQVAGWGGRYGRSVDAFHDILQKDPGDREAQLGLAKVLSWSGRFPEAEDEYEELLEKDPAWREALIGMTYTLSWAGRPTDAEAFFDRIPADQRDGMEVRLAESALEWNLREWGDSRQHLGGLIADFPGVPDVVNLWRAQSSEVGPHVRPYGFMLGAGELEHRRAGVSGAVPVSWPTWAFGDGWTETIELGDDVIDARGARLGLGYSDDRRGNARVWGGFRDAVDVDAGGTTGGLTASWLSRPNVGLFATAESDFIFITPQAIRNDVRMTTVSVGGLKANDRHFKLDGAVSRAWYDGHGIDQTRDEAFAWLRSYLGGVKILRTDVGLRARYFTFDHHIPNAGYFNPEEFREVMLTLAGTWRRGERLGLIFDAAWGQHKIDDGEWFDAWALGTEILYQLTQRLDLAGHLTYTRLNVLTGEYDDHTATISLRAHMGRLGDRGDQD